MDRQAAKMIERLGAHLPSINRSVGSFSGGQQQTVAIARALTFNPKLVIMDEPTAALAVREVQSVLDLIRRLKSEGIAVILISHRLNDVLSVTDRIVVLRHGRADADLVTANTNMNEVVSRIVGGGDQSAAARARTTRLNDEHLWTAYICHRPGLGPRRIEPQIDRLKEYGIGLLEIPLLRPEEIDTKRRAPSPTAWRRALCSLGLPRTLDVVERPTKRSTSWRRPSGSAPRSAARGWAASPTARSARPPGAARRKKEIDGICRFLERAAKQAKGYGLKLGIEPCNRYETHLINRGIDAAKIIERVGADNIFIHLDTYHMHIEEESFAAGFKAAAPYLGYVHVSEANRGVPGAACSTGRPAMKAIAEIGYKGAITLESMNHVDADIAGGLAVWRPVAERPDDVIEVGLPFLREQAKAAGITLG